MRRFLCLISCCAAAVSCLKVPARGEVPLQEAYSTPSSLYVNAVQMLYGCLGSNVESEGLQGTCRGIYDYNTLTTDEAIAPIRGGDWYDGGYWQSLYFHTWTSSDRCLYDVWTWLFGTISKCNESLSVIYGHADILDSSSIAGWTAQVRALRAILLWYAMDIFGNIPLPSVDGGWAAEDLTQVSRSEAFRFIVNELQCAEAVLPRERSNAVGACYGCVTAPVVQFVLAKLALNAEVYADDDWTDGARPSGSGIMFDVGGELVDCWEACIRYCDRIASAGYVLEDDYSSNFRIRNENSLENIFTIPADKDLYDVEFHYRFRSLHYCHGAAYGFQTENGPCATVTAMKAYGYGTDEPDARMRMNFTVDEVIVDGVPVNGEDGAPLVYYPMEVVPNLTGSPYMATAGARMNKYGTDRHSYENGKLQDNDIVLFRYADVLLMKAEALVRSGSDGSEPFGLVRDRVSAPERECTLENILEERLLELAWEGWRRQDLVRFGRYHTAYDQRPELPSESDAHTTVFPIPRKCIRLNPSLRQNKGYE